MILGNGLKILMISSMSLNSISSMSGPAVRSSAILSLTFSMTIIVLHIYGIKLLPFNVLIPKLLDLIIVKD